MQTVLQLHSQKWWLTSIGIRHRISIEHSVTSLRCPSLSLYIYIYISLSLSLSQWMLDVRTNVRCYNREIQWFMIYFSKRHRASTIAEHTSYILSKSIENNTGCACAKGVFNCIFFWYFDLCVDRMPNKNSEWRLNSWKYLDLNLCKCKMCLLNWANDQLNELSSERFLINERES